MTPNFGLFCRFSYCWFNELGVMACIAGDKLTKDRIREKGFFSKLVTESILPLADYLGNKEGYSPDKMNISINTKKGEVLDVPTLTDSPLTFEPELAESICIGDGDVFLCKIRNVLAEQGLLDKEKGLEDRLRQIAPVKTTCSTYFSWSGKELGPWGRPRKDYIM